MGDCCNCNSEISRDGSGQLSRYLKALDPSYAKVDDRSIEDLLVFTKRYANQIRFYDVPESNIPGEEDKTKISWREFFRRDIAVIAASVSLTDTDQIKKDYDELRAKLDVNPSYSIYKNLFDPILGMAVKIDGWYALAIPENPLYADLQLAINSNLKSQIQKIVAYEEGFKYVDTKHALNLDYSKILNKDLWGLNETVDADISIYQGTDTEDKIRNAALYVDDIFNNFYNFLSQLQTSSEIYMQFALEKYPAHQPHMALFIAFLQLFHLAQEQINGITERMLDFYYRDVLHLTAKPSIPDKVHIVFELAKDVAEYDIASGTHLKAGKDALGKDQLYITENDLVVNQAKVKEIKNIFIEKIPTAQLDANGNPKQTLQYIHARAVANSKNGLGEKFTDPNSKWSTFGKGSALTASNNLCDQIIAANDVLADQSQIGFAIASPQLVLQGGKRLIKISAASISGEDPIKALAQALTEIEIWFTGEKEWIKINASDVNAIPGNLNIVQEAVKTGTFSTDDNQSFYVVDPTDNTLCIYLPISEQAVVAFDSKLHPGYNFKTGYPVMLIMNNPSAVLNINEDLYNQLKISNLTIRTKVGSINMRSDNETANLDGLKKLVLQNKDGLLLPDTPFDPFSAYPFLGRSFYIGSDEVFNKPLNSNDALSINIQKTNSTDNGDAKNELYTVAILEKKQWDLLGKPTEFSRVQLTENILIFFREGNERTPINSVNEWKNGIEKGFIRLSLASYDALSFNRDEAALVSSARISLLQISQNAAPALEITEISVSYDSTLPSLQMGTDQFFHIYPFGATETYLNSRLANTDLSISNNQKGNLLVDAGNTLLPQFNFISPYKKSDTGKVADDQTSSGFSIDLPRSTLRSNRNSKSSNAVNLIHRVINITEDSTNQYTGNMQEGMLFIGLENLKPLQSISMLFQFAEGSAEDEDDDPPAINWSYLSYNEWKPLRAENIVIDDTYGFQTTGIIKIDMPSDVSLNNTIITDGLTWLCASVDKDSNRIPQLINIVTQAVEAQFQDNGNDQSHFDNALAAGSISKLFTPVAQVSKVLQPFASFDGKHQEIGKEFYTRVSERLRHKARAINAWDYEHFVLDRFPSIYKVKCITHTDPNCLCTTKQEPAAKEKVFQVSYNENGVFNYAPVLDYIISLIENELKSFNTVKANIIGYGTDANSLQLASRVAKQLNDKLVADGIAANRITTNTSSEGALQTLNIKLQGYPSANVDDCCGPQIAPGHVLIVPIANLKNRNATNPLQPKTSRRTLIEIQEYLKTRTSPFVHVYAKNPVYEQIIVQFQVQFIKGTDKGYYMKQLNNEIVQFLTPWAFSDNADIAFNQKIYASSIINFIEERSYVDFITDFVMGVCCNECCPQVSQTTTGGIIEGTVFDTTSAEGLNNENPLEDIIVKIKELNLTATTDENGKYKISGIPPGNYTLIAYFSLFNIKQQNFSIPDPANTTTPVQIDDFIRGGKQAGYSQEEISAFFSKLCSCNDIEQILCDDINFDGDIVAKPCTSRSILVSVPQHIIIPYEEDPQPSPCEISAANGNAMLKSVSLAKLAKSEIVKTVAENKTVKTTATKKTAKVESVKTASPVIAKKIKAVAVKKIAKTQKPK